MATLELLPAPAGWPADPLVGCQVPTHRMRLPYERTLGDSGELAGFDLDEATKELLRDGLAITEDGRFLARKVIDIESRQNGKTDGVIILMMWATALAGYSCVAYTAHRAETAKQVFERVQEATNRTPELKALLRKDRSNGIRTSNGEWQLTWDNASYIAFRTRTNEVGRGLTKVPLLIIDESQELTDVQNAALSPIQSTATNQQTWYLGSAGDHQSEIQAKLWRGVETGTARRTVYHGWHLDAEADYTSPLSWARVNRAYGIRIDHDEIYKDLEDMSRTKFGTERLGQALYPRPEGEDWPIPKTAWELAQDDGGAPARGARLVVVAEAHPDQTWGSVSVAGRRPDGAMHLELVERDRGVRWLRPYLQEVRAKNDATIYLDPKGPAGFICEELTEAKAPFHTFDANDVVSAFGWLRRGICEEPPTVKTADGRDVPDPSWVRPIRPRTRRELTSSLAGAQVRRLMTGTAWSRYSEEDPSAIISANLAGWGVVLEERRPPKAPPPAPLAVPNSPGDSSGLAPVDWLSARF